MRTRLLAPVVALLIGSGLASGQSPVPLPRQPLTGGAAWLSTPSKRTGSAAPSSIRGRRITVLASNQLSTLPPIARS